MADSRMDLLARLAETAERLLEFGGRVTDPDTPMYDGWSVKKTMAHIMVWHESFARNVRDLAEGVAPSPLRGTYREINERCFRESEAMTLEDVLKRFEAAQSIIARHVLNDKLTQIPYRIGSRSYSPRNIWKSSPRISAAI